MGQGRLKLIAWSFGLPVLALAGLFVVYVVLAEFLPKQSEIDLKHAFEYQRRELHSEAEHLITSDGLARENHRVFTVDLAQLAIYATHARDRALFENLRAILLDNIVVDTPDDPYLHGMVAWGFTADPDDATKRVQSLDASGTTEALRVAEALTLGMDAFSYDDAQTVRDILAAYARHGYAEAHGGDTPTWYIRNYLNLQTRAFATNCFLIDLDPDLVARLAERFDDDALRDLAQRKAKLIEACRIGNEDGAGWGLLHQMIRPEVATAMGPDYVVYSANGHERLNLTLTVAERCVTTNPQAARAAFDFAMDRLDDLRLAYDIDSGQPAHGEEEPHVGPETLAPLLRLAVRLGERDAVETILPHLLRVSADLPESTHPAKLYAIGETLWALEVARRFLALPPSP
ncbi:MAG: hypothetical protein AAGJ38_03285 [Planctomycetota bacterium]